MVDPRILCRNHLLGEHNEMHAFVGTINKCRKVDGYICNNLLEPLSITKRHDELAEEMINRGMNHKSPIIEPDLSYLDESKIYSEVDKEMAMNDLLNRCEKCYENLIYITYKEEDE